VSEIVLLQTDPDALGNRVNNGDREIRVVSAETVYKNGHEVNVTELDLPDLTEKAHNEVINLVHDGM